MSELTLMELLITGGVPLGTIIAAWINMRVTVGGLLQKIDYLEKQLEDEKRSNKQNYNDLSKGIKDIYEILTEIRVKIGE